MVPVEDVQHEALTRRDTSADFGEFRFSRVTVGALPERHVTDRHVEISGEAVKILYRRARHAHEFSRKLDPPTVEDGDAVTHVSHGHG